MSLESCLQTLSEDSSHLNQAELIELSDLPPKELGMVARVWFKLPTERREGIVELLVEEAEDNTELDFSAIFKMCLKDPVESVREKGIIGLWEFEDRSIIAPLVEILNQMIPVRRGHRQLWPREVCILGPGWKDTFERRRVGERVPCGCAKR